MPNTNRPLRACVLDFASDGCLAYTNERMIGRVGLVEDAAEFITAKKLGPDALDPRFDFVAFKSAVLGVKREVKSVLMDQKIVAGIGNIYSDEIPFQYVSTRPRVSTRLARASSRNCFRSCRQFSNRSCPRRRLGTIRGTNAKKGTFAGTQEGRALPALPLAPEGIQG